MEHTKNEILMSHNVRVYEEAKEVLNKHGRVAVVQPTGTGKSYIAMQIMQDMGECKKLVIAPSRAYLNIMENNKYWDKNNITTLTYAYMSSNVNSIENKLIELIGKVDDVKLIVIDEFHRAGAPEWGKALEVILKICKNAMILGLSATPVRNTQKRDMVEELFNGYSVGNMSLKDAIEADILPKLHYVLGVSNSSFEINRMMKKNVENIYFFNKLERQIDDLNNKWSYRNTFKNTLKKYLIPNGNTDGLESRHIVFVSRLKELNEYKEYAEQWFSEIYNGYKIEVDCLNSKMPKVKVNEALENFSSQLKPNTIKVIVTVQMLNESFHFDSVKSVSMFRNTEAPNIFIQQIGRALSAKSQSPYIFDFVENFSSVGHLAFTAGNSRSNIIDSNLIFESFNDETGRCIEDINKLEETLANRVKFYTHMLPNLAKQYNSLYSIPDDKLREWSIHTFKKLRANKSSLYGNNEFRLTRFILLSAGEKWYEQYNSFNSLTEDELKQFKKNTLLLFECNCMDNYIQQLIQESTGINLSDSIKTLEEYMLIVSKSTNVECKQICKLIKAMADNNKYGIHIYMNECMRIYSYTRNKQPVFCTHIIDKAYAYKVWEIISKDERNIELSKYELSNEEKLLCKILRKYSSYINMALTKDEFIMFNKGILSRNIGENPGIIDDILKKYSIFSIDKLIKIVDNIYGFKETTERLNLRCKLITDGTITSKEVKESIKVELDGFIDSFKTADILGYFRDIFESFQQDTMHYAAVAFKNEKYHKTETATERIKTEEDKRSLYAKTITDRNKIQLSLERTIRNRFGNGCWDIRELVGKYVSMVNDALKQKKILFNISLLYKMHKLYCMGIDEYKEVYNITNNKETILEIDLLIIKPTLRNKVINTAKRLEKSKITFESAAIASNLYNNLTYKDELSISNILDSGVEHSGSLIYVVLMNIGQLSTSPYSSKVRQNICETITD